MREVRFVLWEELEQYVQDLISKLDVNSFDCIYGITRGGLVPAVMLSHRLNMPMIEKDELEAKKDSCLVVDDMCETGFTIKSYLNRGFKCAVLISKLDNLDGLVYAKLDSLEKWPVFPFETEETSKADYREKHKEEEQ